MTATYRALRLERIADDFRSGTRIVTLPVEEPGPVEIRVRNHWAGVNGIFDNNFARGKAGYMAADLPSFTGVEAVGVVEAVGSAVPDFTVGDTVGSMRFRSGYREVNIADASHFAHLPDAGPESLALASTGVAALLALEHAGRLRDGETVAVSAAAGGLGHLIVQLAKLRGCHVIAICGGADKAGFVRNLGADRVIDYRAEDVASVLAQEYRDAIDVAVDTVGGNIFDALAANLAPHARLVISGAAQDQAEEPPPGPRIAGLIYFKAACVQAFQNGLVQHLWPGARARLFALHSVGALRVTCGGFQGIEAVYDAVDFLSSGRSIGKVAVDLSPNNQGV